MIRHRLAAIGGALLVIGVLLAVASQLRVGELTPTSLARNGPAEVGLQDLQHRGFPLGVLQPIEVLVPGATHAAPLAARLDTVAGVDTAIAPTGPDWRKDGTALVEVIPDNPTSSKPAKTTVAAVEHLTARSPRAPRSGATGPSRPTWCAPSTPAFPSSSPSSP